MVRCYNRIVKVALSYLLVLSGAGLVGYAVAMVKAIHCDYPQVRFRIISALRTQPWQAEIFTKTKPGSFFDGIHAAMKSAGSTGLRDPVQLAQVTRPSYDAAVAPAKAHWKGIFSKFKMGGTAMIGGLIMAITVHTSLLFHILLLIAAVIAAIWMISTKTDCDRYGVLARHEILPEVDRAIAEGRYGKPS